MVWNSGPSKTDKIYIAWEKDAAAYEALLAIERDKTLTASGIFFCVGLILGLLF